MTPTLATFRSPGFDLFFVVFIPISAIMVAFYVAYNVSDFFFILTLNIWLLGYHHVISTFTRVASSTFQIKEHKWLMLYLPPVVLASVIGLDFIGSVIIISTVYLHWQWWHYTRQSEGISKAIQYKTGCKLDGNSAIHRAAFYGTATLSFLVMSSRNAEVFLGMPVATLPVPTQLTTLLTGCFLVTSAAWVGLLTYQLTYKKISGLFFLYQMSHIAIYYIAYVFFKDINIGWLAINIWHNLQYITFVWLTNRNTYGNGIDENNKIVSWLSQPNRAFLYFTACLGATFIFYKTISMGANIASQYLSIPLVLIIFMSINFHHYVVDTVIWKIKKPTTQKAIGISQ